MLDHLQFDYNVLARIDARIAREHEEKHYRPEAVPIVESSAGNILVARSAKSGGRWGYPQGGIERGESVIKGLFRELKGEVGVEPSVVRECRFCYATRRPVSGCRDGFVLGKSYYFFYLQCCSVPTVTLQEEEVDDYLWIEPHRLGDFFLGRASLQKTEAMLTALLRAWRA